MRKITFIGGGSAKFVSTLVQDLFTFPEMQDTHFTLMDIDAERMARTERLINMLITEHGLPATVDATTDQRAALDGADYVIITIMVGGFEKYYSDGAIPIKYGVLPTVGDTIGPGGVFRLIRTHPVLQQIADNLSEVSPDAWVLNYSNPMAMNVLALIEAGHQRTVGLCHSVQWSYRELAKWAGVPEDKIEQVHYTAGGINHVNFYLTLSYQGEDLYPILLAKKDEIIAERPMERVRFELLEYLGYWPAEGPEHQSEYSPWFRKNEETVNHYQTKTMWGYNVDKSGNEALLEQVNRRLNGEVMDEWHRSREYGSYIMHSLETGELTSFYGNVLNTGLIENLPRRAVVEVPCLVDHNGVFPCHVGLVPPQLSSLQAQHICVHQLALSGVQQRNRPMIRQAIQADPLTSAILTLPQIKDMVDEMFAENAEYMQDWR